MKMWAEISFVLSVVVYLFQQPNKTCRPNNNIGLISFTKHMATWRANAHHAGHL